VSHVALVIPGLDWMGGAERQVILLAKGLRQRGWRVSVVALSGTGGPAAAELMAAGTTFLSLQMRKGLADPRGWIRFHRWLRQERPDVVHAHLPHAAWLARWSRLGMFAFPAPVQAAEKGLIPCEKADKRPSEPKGPIDSVGFMRGLKPPPPSGPDFSAACVVIDTLHSSSTGSLGRRLGYRLSGWLADRVTAVSQAVAQKHLAARMVSGNKLSVLPNGVDVEAWRPDAAVRATMRRELGLTDEFLWLAAGRLEAVKDYPTLLQAMAGTPEAARLVIAGCGPLQNELLRLCARLGLDGRVHFLGFEPDVKRWMQAADGFVLSSRWEGLPMGLLEAAACALPAVATDVSGTREAIVPGQTGCLAPAGDAAALGRAMTAMMQAPPEERHAMGERARQQAVERFSLETVLDQWEALYGELLGRGLHGIASARSGKA
jgi:glycosyltransferase involved in cell wall biosynthesis